MSLKKGPQIIYSKITQKLEIYNLFLFFGQRKSAQNKSQLSQKIRLDFRS